MREPRFRSSAKPQLPRPRTGRPPPPSAASSRNGTLIERYQARVSATQAEQPHWITPLVAVTPRLEQEIRTDFVHQYNSKGFAVWNYSNGKGLEFLEATAVSILLFTETSMPGGIFLKKMPLCTT